MITRKEVTVVHILRMNEGMKVQRNAVVRRYEVEHGTEK